jgi:CRISPR-associated protein Cmr4
MSTTRIYWLHTLSPTHAGIGRGQGYIDLPVDRDQVTGWPLVRASSIKGVWADRAGATSTQKRETNPLLKAAFGTAGSELSNSGAIMPTDARIVCLPVRSFRGTFAWCASPMSLRMLRRSVTAAGPINLPDAPPELPDSAAHHPPESALVEDGQIFLEDLNFTARSCPTADGWAKWIASELFRDDPDWSAQFRRRFAVIPDLAFDFLCQTGTEVHTRVRIDPAKKTVVDGALWTEESLPAETILMGVVRCDRLFSAGVSSEDVVGEFLTRPLQLQIGGKATVGRGQVRCIFSQPGGVR